MLIPLLLIPLISEVFTFLLVSIFLIFIITETNLNISNDKKNLRLAFYVILFLPTYLMLIQQVEYFYISIYIFHLLAFILGSFIIYKGVIKMKNETVERSQFSYINDEKFPFYLLREVATIFFITGISSILFLYNSFSDIKWLLIPVLTVVTVDSMSYFVGSLYGKRKIKLIFSLSPNKSFEGYLAGYFSGVIFFLIINYIFHFPIDNNYWFYFLTVMVPFFAILGDLYASGVKRNYGVDNAKYDLVAFLDSDDIWVQNKLEKQIDVMKKHDIYFCSSSIKRFSGKTPKIKIATDLNYTKINFKKLLIRCYIPLSSVIFNKNKFNFRFDESKDLIAFEDYDSWLKIHKKINFSIKLKSQLVLYRVSDSQISKDKSLRFYQHYKIRNKHINSKLSKIYSCCYIFLMLFHLAFNYLFKKL